jgi:hypothetical protein
MQCSPDLAGLDIPISLPGGDSFGIVRQILNALLHFPRRFKLKTSMASTRFNFALISLILLTVTAARADDNFEKYKDEANTISARVEFKKFCSAEFIYFMEEKVDASGKLQPQTFMAASAIPAQIPGVKGIQGEWSTTAGWKELGIEESQPLRFRYSIITSGEGSSATFTARAEFDPFGTGKVRVYEVVGHLSASGTPICDPMKVSQL